MPLPPALLAKLAKRGIISKSPSSSTQNKENEKQEEEIIVESYDETESRGHKKDSHNNCSNGDESMYENDDFKSSINAKFMGHQGCPNKYNVWHECTFFCKEYWGEGKKKPGRKYMHYRKKMLEQHPLPDNWTEVYDPGTGRFYYWDEENDVVSWLPPSHRRALITDSAARFREERFMVEGDKNAEDGKKSDSDSDGSSDSSTSSAEMKKKKKKYSSSDKDSDKSDEEKTVKTKLTRNDRNFNRRKVVKANDIDPMDPAAYSNIPRGTWSDGLNKGLEAKTGADVTAAGPLYQMRPYPNPGAVLRANAKQKNNDSD